MNPLRTAAILGGVVLIGGTIYAYFKRQYDLLTDFEWKVINIKFDSVSLTLLKGKIVFRFTNKSDIEITISNFYLDMYLNNTYIGWLQDTRAFVIPASGFNDIEFGFSLNPQLVIKNALDILSLGTRLKDAMFSFKGAITARSGFVKASVPIDCDCSVKNMDCAC